jgi:hypothetical protein
MLDPVTQHVDRAALADLSLQPRQELAPRRAVLTEVQRIDDFRLTGVGGHAIKQPSNKVVSCNAVS